MAAPALIVTAPLAGYSLLGDDRRRVYKAARVGSDPIDATTFAWDTVDFFIDRGNFRLLGRILETLVRGFIFDAAEATGLAPQVSFGVIRLTLVAVLAISCTLVALALLRSDGSGSGSVISHPATVLYPMILATALVAADLDSPMISYSVLVLGSTVGVVLISLLIARDKDMLTRPLAWHEPPLMVVLGIVAAGTYDLTFLAPVITGAFVMARHVTACSRLRAMLQVAALRRWAYFVLGFCVLFVPIRIMIASRCRRLPCYPDSDIQVLPIGELLSFTGERLLTGLPPSGWFYSAGLLREAGVDFGISDLIGNMLLVLLVAATLVVTIRSVHQLISGFSQGEGALESSRAALGLVVFGGAICVAGAMLAGLSRGMRAAQLPIGESWRDTILVQIGWSLIATAVVVLVFERAKRRRVLASEESATHRAAGADVWYGIRFGVMVTTASVIVCTGLVLALLANARLIQLDRLTPLHAITSEIATTTVHFDVTDAGNARRCRLIDDYTEHVPDSKKWLGGPNVADELNALMLDRYSLPYCDADRAARNGS